MTDTKPTSVAIIGSGISGLTCAHLLGPHYTVTLFEADDRLGGHTNTVPVTLPGPEHHNVDTGFIVFNEHNYPGFITLLDQLGVASQPSTMSFSVSSAVSNTEYRGTNLNTLYAQRSNLLKPSFHRMLIEILRFNRLARTQLLHDQSGISLDEFVSNHRFSQRFREEFLIPLGASIWSADPRQFLDFPASSYAHFMNNHGLLNVAGLPKWRTIVGGSSTYVKALIEKFSGTVRLATPVRSVHRSSTGGIGLRTDNGTEHFDAIVLAGHSDQSLKTLSDATDAEQSILGAIRFQPNIATLHTDERFLPRNKRCRASWNYHIDQRGSDTATLSYWMNELQSITSSHELLVTLNRANEIDRSKVLAEFNYAHPVFDQAAMAAQLRRDEIQGINNTYFAGAWWGFGFHEDGVQSALDVCARLGVTL
ncbi:MAG: FAD-dependent oxidoreductase [Acidimicrobiales bacterium]